MKYKSVKYILLSVAITSSLLFTACGKKSEPVAEVSETTQTEEPTTTEEPEQDETVYMDESGIPEFNSKQGKTTTVAADKAPAGVVMEEGLNTGVDYEGSVLPGEYDEEIHSTNAQEEKTDATTTNQPPSQHDEEYQKMLEEMAADIFQSYLNETPDPIPADPEAEARLGLVPASEECTDPDSFGRTEVPDHLKGPIEFE